MSKYFDKDFFKFSIGFATIISISLIIILATRIYQEQAFMGSEQDTASAVNAVQPKNK